MRKPRSRERKVSIKEGSRDILTQEASAPQREEDSRPVPSISCERPILADTPQLSRHWLMPHPW